MKQCSEFLNGLLYAFLKVNRCNGYRALFISLTSCFVLLANLVLAQEVVKEKLPNAIPPSPNVAALHKFEQIPISMYTGAPDVTVPLYTVQVGDLQLPINLAYHSSGVKVQEIASSVGLGWGIFNAGVISVSQKGLDDEGLSGYLYNNSYARKRVEKYMNGELSLSEAEDLRYTIAMGQEDSEPDIYNFSFLGKSGKFMIDTNDVFVPIPYQDIKIVKTNGNFMLTDQQGNRFFFNEKETTLAIPKSRKDSEMLPYYDAHTYTSSWHLNKIMLYSGQEIDFSYVTTTITPTYTVAEASYDLLEAYYPITACRGQKLAFDRHYKYYSWTETQIQQKKLKTINFPGGQVEFNYNATERLDLPGDFALKDVIIYNKTTTGLEIVNKFVFSQIYGSNRLFLQSVEEKGKAENIEHISHEFTYNNINSLPGPTSKSIDYWGYYNAKNNTTLIPTSFDQRPYIFNGADRSANPGVLKYGVLERITYPTKGYANIDYEPHQYGNISGSKDILDSLYLETDTTSYLQGPATGTVATKAFTITYTQQVVIDSHLSGYQVYTRLNGPDNRSYFIHSAPRTSEIEHKSNTVTLEPGEYTLVAFNYEEEFTCNIAVSYKKKSLKGLTKNHLAGGLRVKAIRRFDKDGAIVSTRSYEYKMQSEPDRSSGILVSDFYNSYYKTTSVYNNCTTDPTRADYEINYGSYLVRFSYSSLPLALSQGSHVVYSEVLVRDSTANSNGYSLHEFLSPKEHGDLIFDTFPFAVGVSYDYMRGQLKRQADYVHTDKGFKRISTKTNTYEIHGDATSGAPGVIVGFEAEDQIYGANVYKEHSYRLFTLRFNLVESVDTLFDYPAERYVIGKKNFYYDSPLHNLLTKETFNRSDGAENTTVYNYPFEARDNPPQVFSAGFMAALDTLIGNNRIAVPVEVLQYKDNDFLSSELTVYKNWNLNNKVKALPELIMSRFRTGPYSDEVAFSKYDGRGNVIEFYKQNNIPTTYVWSYNYSYPIAEIRNASYAEVEAAMGGATTMEILANSTVPDQLQLDLVNTLRSQLPNAMVTTYTYSPLVGMVSSTDPNGLRTQYNYDFLGRLKTVIDHEGSIVRSYEYYYTGQ